MDELFKAGESLPGQQAPSGVPLGVNPKDMEFNEEAVSPEEQKMYDQFVLKAQGFIAQSAENIVNSMNNQKKPVYQNVGGMALKIAHMIGDSAKASGVEISPDIIFHGGAEVVELLMEVGDAGGIWPFKPDSSEFEEASAMALMHGAEMAARETMESPDYGTIKDEAGTFMAQQIGQEQKQGEVPPEFFEGLENQVATGVNQAINGG